jgi:DNA-binding CsgD family transcriptional regulator
MKEVAYLLNVTPRTVAFHKYTMMDQLQLKSSAELIQFAMKSSIVAA